MLIISDYSNEFFEFLTNKENLFEENTNPLM